MAVGPVQLVVLGFDHPDFQGEIIEQLENLRRTDTVRVIDALAVYKDPRGDLEVEHLSNLTEDEAIELGSTVAALIGLEIDGETGADMVADAAVEAEAATEELWDVLADIPPDSAAAVVLLEHQWAVPLRDAVMRAGGFRISDGFISPLDLVAIGLQTSDEAATLDALDRASAMSSGR
jgi:uncharacterized membrane protein